MTGPTSRHRLSPPAALLALAAAAALSALPASLAAQVGAVGSVVGAVVDSVAGGAPLVGATVQLVRQDDPTQARTTASDSLGAFLLEGVPAGRYLLGFLHPRLDDLMLRPPLRVLDVAAGGVLRADLAVPSGRTIASALCSRTAATADDSTALFLGRVYRADAETAPTAAEVTVEWLELVLSDGGMRQERRVARATTDGEGRFALCGVPVDAGVLAQAQAGDARSGQIELRVAPGALLHRDLLVAPVTTAGDAVAGDAALARGTARVRGRVRTGNDRPFARAQVLLHGSGRADTTGGDGAFTLDSLPAGTHMLEARAIGLVPRRVAVDLRAGGTAVVDLALDERVPTLETVTVYGTPDTRRDVTGFLRRSAGGFGHFLTPAMIERRNAYSVPDLLRMTPGVRVQPSGSFGSVVTMRGQASFEGDCLPAVFLDGVFLHEGAMELERIVHPSQVMGIEVYTGPATVPPEFERGACGSILIWTKRG